MTTISLKTPLPYVGVGRPWYDTKEGIVKKVKTLDDFNELRYERHQAFKRGETLNDLYVLGGNYRFDSCGNCLRAEVSIKELFPKIPDVLDYHEFNDFMKIHADPEKGGCMYNYEPRIPSSTVLCPICKKNWTLENMYDVVMREDHSLYVKNSQLTDFIGKTLLDVKRYYAAKTDADYYIGFEPFMYAEHFKDNTPKYPGSIDEWEKEQVKNSDGRVGTKDGITDDYIIRKGDDISGFVVRYFYHSGCNKVDLEAKTGLFFKEIFTSVGFKQIEMQSIPNEYSSSEWDGPWFKITTEIGMIKIGWRKRVMNIDWIAIRCGTDNFLHLFASEDVTKGENYIHAWSKEKAIEYLTAIKNYLKK